MKKSIMPPEILGAYVSCYARGQSYVEATEKALKKLSEDGLYPEEILQPIYEINSSSWSQHVAEKWPDNVDGLLSQSDFEAAMQADRVIYGPFGAYE
jgi:hypothetical protein